MKSKTEHFHVDFAEDIFDETEKEEKLMEKISDLVVKKMAVDDSLTYKAAFKMVLEENPDILKIVKAMREKIMKTPRRRDGGVSLG